MRNPEELYSQLRKQAKEDYSGSAMSELLSNIIIESAKYLQKNCNLIKLNSLVANKNYYCFQSSTNKLSRPLNQSLFEQDFKRIIEMCKRFSSFVFKGMSLHDTSKLFYTIGMYFPCYIDIIKQNDKKTPGTFFEYLIGHIFAHRLGTNPRKQLAIPVVNGEEPKHLPTDLIFDFPEKHYGLHVPVKSTTRERVIQVWAHQRILDSVYGEGRFRGILVVTSETKLDSRKKEVIEICLPSQWKIYQLHIAKLRRIYYLDPPKVYLNLKNSFPNVPVYPFSDFFKEPITSF